MVNNDSPLNVHLGVHNKEIENLIFFLHSLRTKKSLKLYSKTGLKKIVVLEKLFSHDKFLDKPFTKPPLLQESRLTGGGSPNLVVLVEWKVHVERFFGAANSYH